MKKNKKKNKEKKKMKKGKLKCEENFIMHDEVCVPTKFSQIQDTDFSDILISLNEMLDAKDKAYGNSALNPLEIFARFHKYGSRIDEKLARVKNGHLLRKNDVVDIIGGLLLICRDNEWNDFSDQID